MSFTDNSYANRFLTKNRTPIKGISYKTYIAKEENTGIINFGFDCPFCKSYVEGWSKTTPIGCGLCSYVYYGKEELPTKEQRPLIKQASLL